MKKESATTGSGRGTLFDGSFLAEFFPNPLSTERDSETGAAVTECGMPSGADRSVCVRLRHIHRGGCRRDVNRSRWQDWSGSDHDRWWWRWRHDDRCVDRAVAVVISVMRMSPTWLSRCGLGGEQESKCENRHEFQMGHDGNFLPWVVLTGDNHSFLSPCGGRRNSVSLTSPNFRPIRNVCADGVRGLFREFRVLTNERGIGVPFATRF